MPGLAMPCAMKSDSVTLDSIKELELKAVAGDISSGMSDPSSSRAILTENLPNGSSENPADISTVYAAIQKQGERMDRILDLYQNQAKTLEQHGKSIKAQAEALNAQGNALKTQGDILKEHKATLKDHGDKLNMNSMVIKLLFQNQQNLIAAFRSVRKEIDILKKNETKLKMIEDNPDKFGKLDLKSVGSNRVLPVPFNLCTNNWNGIIAASLYPVRPYGIIEPNVQPFIKDTDNV